jgi:tryptophan halogenase
VTRLLQLFPFGGVNPTLQDRFNHLADQEIIRIRDFIILHYKATERTDTPYWDRCRTMEIPDSLAQRIELFRENAQVYQVPGELFQVDSWLQVMLGQRLKPKRHHLLGRVLTEAELRQSLVDLKAGVDRALARMPSHQEFLEAYAGTIMA